MLDWPAEDGKIEVRIPVGTTKGCGASTMISVPREHVCYMAACVGRYRWTLTGVSLEETTERCIEALKPLVCVQDGHDILVCGNLSHSPDPAGCVPGHKSEDTVVSPSVSVRVVRVAEQVHILAGRAAAVLLL
uniref:Uncharacterized protein n=1 Tax=Timema bartmani TaxID=61472 RepID=A0A7R9ENK6_9NEOP|nr:unnamed protein product [Timema bartmani]